MFELVAVVEGCLSILKGSADIGSSAAEATGRSITSEQKAMAELLAAASDALTSAQYLATLGKAGSSNLEQTLLALMGFWAAEGKAPWNPAAAARPLMRTLIPYALASDLVTQHAVRHDVRETLRTTQRLVLAHQNLQRTAGPEAREAGATMVAAVEAVYSTLPHPSFVGERLLHRSAHAARRAAFTHATQRAWVMHGAIVATKPRRVGLLRRRRIQYQLPTPHVLESSSSVPQASAPK